MIITLEHEDIEAALIAWMNDKGIVAASTSTSIQWTQTGSRSGLGKRVSATINPQGKQDENVNSDFTLHKKDDADVKPLMFGSLDTPD